MRVDASTEASADARTEASANASVCVADVSAIDRVAAVDASTAHNTTHSTSHIASTASSPDASRLHDDQPVATALAGRHAPAMASESPPATPARQSATHASSHAPATPTVALAAAFASASTPDPQFLQTTTCMLPATAAATPSGPLHGTPLPLAAAGTAASAGASPLAQRRVLDFTAALATAPAGGLEDRLPGDGGSCDASCSAGDASSLSCHTLPVPVPVGLHADEREAGSMLLPLPETFTQADAATSADNGNNKMSEWLFDLADSESPAPTSRSSPIPSSAPATAGTAAPEAFAKRPLALAHNVSHADANADAGSGSDSDGEWLDLQQVGAPTLAGSHS